MRALAIILAYAITTSGYGQEATFGWNSDVDTFLYTDEEKAIKAVEKGDLGGALNNVHAGASGSARARATYATSGKGYTLGATLDVEASGSVVQHGLTQFSTASVDATTSWNDRLHLVGEGQLPTGSLLLKFKGVGQFHSSLDQSQELSQVVGVVEFQDRSTGESYGRIECVKEWNRSTGTLFESGPNEISATFTLTKTLGDDRAADYGLKVAYGSTATNGRCELLMGHTTRLESITFPDGSTPESHGFQIVFDSGLRSPNRLTGDLVADFGHDGLVDADDLREWRLSYGEVLDGPYLAGDANGDGIVDGADFLIWQHQVQLAPIAAAVAEPATASFCGCLVVAAVVVRRRIS